MIRKSLMVLCPVPAHLQALFRLHFFSVRVKSTAALMEFGKVIGWFHLINLYPNLIHINYRYFALYLIGSTEAS